MNWIYEVRVSHDDAPYAGSLYYFSRRPSPKALTRLAHRTGPGTRGGVTVRRVPAGGQYCDDAVLAQAER